MNQYSQLRELLQSIFRLSTIVLFTGGGLIFLSDKLDRNRPFERHITSKLPYLVALDSKTGRYLWSVPIESSKVGSVTAQSGKLFITGEHRLGDRFEDRKKEQYHLTALDARNGKRLWEFKAPAHLNDEAFITPPDITSENVTIAVNSDPKSKGKIITLNQATGEVKWSIDRPWMHKLMQSGITLQKNKTGILKLQSTGISIERVEPLTGKSLWTTVVDSIPKWSKYPLALTGVYQIASTDQYFLVLNDEKKLLYAYDWETGRLKNTIPGSFSFRHGSSIAKNNLLYDTAAFESLKAINIETGKELWKADTQKISCMSESVSIVPQGLILACEEFLRNQDLMVPSSKPKKRWLANFDLLSGQQRSLTQLEETDFSKQRSPIAESSGLLFTVSGEKPEKIVAIDPANGRLIWEKDSEELDNWVAPITEGDRVYVVAQIPRWRTWLGHISPFK
jgi:outer membrane protein assembly factor BamB